MQPLRRRALLLVTTSAAAVVLSWGSAANAQEQAASGETTLEEVVVTGTQIRGVAPAGAAVVGLNEEAIQATGALTTSQLMATVPQVANQFATLPVLGTTTTSQVQVNRLNLRNLPGGNVQSGNTTLLLVDGHRITSAGVNQFAPDADVVPPSIIERVEVVPDGGSSIYGTDAVGGVINFITRKRVDGLSVDVRGGWADGYDTLNTNITGGKAWESGSAYLAWDFARNSNLLARHRDYIKNIDWNTGVPIGRQCNPPNIVIANVNYAYPGLQAGTVNACDTAAEGVFLPEQKRNSLFAGLNQELSESLTLDVRGFYTERKTEGLTRIVRGSVDVTSANPFYVTVPGRPGATQNVQFAFNSPFGETGDRTKLSEWGVTPTLTADLPGDWQVRGLVNVGGSRSRFSTQSLNPTLLAQYGAGSTTSTAINPYDVAATPNQQLVANIMDFGLFGKSRVEMQNVRVVADGPLFTLPGGAVRLAAGAEYLRNHLKTKNAGAGLTSAAFESTPYSSHTQDVTSVFGEVQIPIVGRDNAVPGIHALNLSASARYDRYNDFGSTTNPKVGLTYEPVEWLTLRGSWGKSFNAPTPVDQLGSLANTLLIVPAFFVRPPNTNPPPGSVLIALQGSAPDLQPQKAEIYSVGGDVRWPFISGLKSSVTYYDIDFKNLLAQPPVFNPALFFANFPNNFVLNPTLAQVAAFAAQAPNGSALVQQYLDGSPTVFELIDFRRNNFGRAKVRGLDFSTEYRRPMDFGGIDVTLNGNYELENKVQQGPGTPVQDVLASAPKLRLSGTLGADVGQLRVQATVRHVASYKVPANSGIPQSSVDDFTVLNLYFRYDLKGDGLQKDLSFSLNVDNVFDTDPPEYRASNGNGYSGLTSTVGRYVQVGVRKEF